MKRYLLIILTAIFCCVTNSGWAYVSVSKDVALKIAKETVGEGDYDYYIGTCNYKFKIPEPILIVDNNAWLIFVDEDPNSGWEHPCKYIYVKKIARSKEEAEACEIIDSVCPPANITLSPVEKKNRYSTETARMKPIVPKTNAPNPAAGNTYAVILDGGMSVTSHHERYWNDCSFIYKVLRNTHEVPKQNITVIMSDGTDDGADLNTVLGGYVSSPLDLDGDGIDDVEYSATKENLQTVFANLAQKLTDDDHLLFFVTDHGGRDIRTGRHYLYLWNNEKLYSDELAAYLEPIDAGFISIVMGQCYSGGFIDDLKGTNRIIATACSDDEMSFGSMDIPYDEFLYHWTSAINGADALGNKVKAQKDITLLDAQAYAAMNDFYANDTEARMKETPQINYFTHSVAYDLSMTNIPPVVDICFDNYKTPVVSKQQTYPYKAVKNLFIPTRHGDIGRYYNQLDVKNLYVYKFWNNPYIWIRNQDDGRDVQKTEKPDIQKMKPVFVYTKVRNKGVKPYNKKNIDVKTYWTQSTLAISEAEWTDYMTTNKNVGGHFCTETVTDYLQPGSSSIVELYAIFSGKHLDSLQASGSNLCILAYIKKTESEEGFPVDENGIAEVWNTDKLGQSNVCIIEKLTMYGLATDTTSILVNNPTGFGSTFGVYVYNIDRINELIERAQLSMKISPNLKKSWENGGMESVDMTEDRNKQNVFLIQSDTAKLQSLQMSPYQSSEMRLSCNFFADNEITEKLQYDVDFVMIDETTGKCLGGETFRIIQEPRAAINPTVETIKLNGMTTLKAANIAEDVTYRWYDTNGLLVGTGSTFDVPAGKPLSSYKLTVEAISDGAISSANSLQVESSSIKSVDTRSLTKIDVELEGPITGNSVLRLASATGNIPATEYTVESGATSYSIPAQSLPSGVYQVTLIESGNVTGVKKFTK